MFNIAGLSILIIWWYSRYQSVQIFCKHVHLQWRHYEPVTRKMFPFADVIISSYFTQRQRWGGGRGRQLPTAAIIKHGGRRSRYGMVFDMHANIKQTFLGFVVYIRRIRNDMRAFIEHCHLNYTSWLLQLDGNEKKRRIDGNSQFLNTNTKWW